MMTDLRTRIADAVVPVIEAYTRDQALRAARSMRERVLAGVVDLLETHGTTDDLLNDVDRLRALPLLPDTAKKET